MINKVPSLYCYESDEEQKQITVIKFMLMAVCWPSLFLYSPSPTTVNVRIKRSFLPTPRTT